LRFLRERDETTSTKQHENYTASRSSATFALIGGILTWIFFPILAADYIDAAVSSSTPYTSLYSVIFAMSAATLTSFMVSPLFNNGLLIRDIIYGPVAGGVASVTASYWVVNPVYSIVIGVVSATIQVIVMNLIEKKFARENSIFNTYSFTLFGIQGLIGAIFAAIWDAGLRSNTYGFTYNF
jgi:ammonia channel protein AmtB